MLSHAGVLPGAENAVPPAKRGALVPRLQGSVRITSGGDDGHLEMEQREHVTAVAVDFAGSMAQQEQQQGQGDKHGDYSRLA